MTRFLFTAAERSCQQKRARDLISDLHTEAFIWALPTGSHKTLREVLFSLGQLLDRDTLLFVPFIVLLSVF